MEQHRPAIDPPAVQQAIQKLIRGIEVQAEAEAKARDGKAIGEYPDIYPLHNALFRQLTAGHPGGTGRAINAAALSDHAKSRLQELREFMCEGAHVHCCQRYRSLTLLRAAEDACKPGPPKGQPGRPGYPREAWMYATTLRKKHPEMTAKELRLECLKVFDRIDVPEGDAAFRAWLNRQPKTQNKKRTN
jgi:hypothetical protein